MKKVFLIHGYRGEPNGGWRPWLMGELAREDIWACALPMPTPDAPKKDEWVKAIAEAVSEPNQDVFLVGHSLGAPAILRYLESLPEGVSVGGVLLASSPIKSLGEERYALLEHFFADGFDFGYIKSKSLNFVVVHGDNDPIVPFSHSQELSQKLSCEIISIKNGQHLNGKSGWNELPEALKALHNMF